VNDRGIPQRLYGNSLVQPFNHLIHLGQFSCLGTLPTVGPTFDLSSNKTCRLPHLHNAGRVDVDFVQGDESVNRVLTDPSSQIEVLAKTLRQF
jgi:hypothetical protein